MNKEIESPFFDNVREIWDKGIKVLEFQYKKAVLGVDVSKTPKWLVPKWEVSNQKAFATNLQWLFEEIASNLDECNGLELDRYIFSLIIPFKGLADVLHNDNLARMGEESVNIWKPFNDWVFDMLQKADIYQSGNGIIEGCCMTLSNLYGVTYMYSNMLDAALLERGIDLLSIQKQVGITLLSRRDITQIGHYLGTPERAKTLINKVAPEPELQQPQPKESPEPQHLSLPKELDSDEAARYFNKAINLGVMNREYHWLKGLQLLACFAREMSLKLCLNKAQNSDGTPRISWKPFEQLFGIESGKLRGNYNDIQKTGQEPKDIDFINMIFE